MKNFLILQDQPESAFEGCADLISVTLPSGLTALRARTFADCGSLTSIRLPDSLTAIERHAFNGCESLTALTLPGSLTSIGSYAFSDCGLKNLNIPDSVSSIGHGK